MASSSSSSSSQTGTCLNFITHLLNSLKGALINVFLHEQKLQEEEQLSQAIAFSPSSSPQMKHQVFLSFRGEDTRLNFTAHLLEALKDTGMSVFFDEEKLEKGEQLSPALSRAIAASNLSVIVLSKDYASSKSCLAEVSDIMDRKDTQGHIVLPIFYHVDPSHVRNIGGSFKTSFEEHESKSLHQVQRWKAAFTEVGKLKGWHIEGSKFDRPETEYIKDIVEYVIKKLMNSYSRSVCEEWVGIDDQKRLILGLVEQQDSHVIGLWGMGGIGKTTLAQAVYDEISPKFKDSCFLQNVSEKIEKQGIESVRNDFLSELLRQEIRIRTPSITSAFIQERLNNKTVIVVLDDVHDSDQIDYMGVEHFGHGSKIIVTSRDRQVLINGGVDKIHGVNKLNENDSLQLFSTFAFKQLNPTADFLDLSKKFVEYAQGNPLGLKVLGSQLYKKSRRDWESESAVNLREIHLNKCKNLRKIPNLKGATKLEILDCNGCQNLVQLPCLNHLTSLDRLDLQGCRNLGKFPEIPNHFPSLKLSETRIEEVPDSIEHLVLLERLYLENSRVKKVSSNISKLESLESLDLSHCPLVEFPEISRSLTGLNLCGTEIEEVASSSDCLCNSRCLDMSSSSIQKLQCNVPWIGSRELEILRFKSLRYLKMSHCKSLKVLSELPPYLRYLNAHDCTSLEKVSFACQNQHLYEFHSFDGEYDFSMVFSNCLSLSQDSVDNIEANVMIKIGSLAEIWKWASKNDYGPDSLFCCYAGNEILANRFEYQSVKSSLTLQIAPEGRNGRRFLVFSICLVADLRHCHGKANLQCICEYQLTSAGSGGNEKFKTEWHWCEPDYESELTYMGDHVFILFNRDMIKKDKDYAVASFEFSVNNLIYGANGSRRSDHIKVEKSGVHVSYVDEEPSPNPQHKLHRHT